MKVYAYTHLEDLLGLNVSFSQWDKGSNCLYWYKLTIFKVVSVARFQQVRNEMESLVREHGVNAFQMFMAYKDMMMLRDSELYQALQTCKDIGAIARVHAENGELVAEVQKYLLIICLSYPYLYLCVNNDTFLIPF